MCIHRFLEMNPTPEQSIFTAIGIGFIKSIVCAYDILTYPIYTLMQRPWEFRQRTRRVRAKFVNPQDPNSGKYLFFLAFICSKSN